jgi:hypothetical protein
MFQPRNRRVLAPLFLSPFVVAIAAAILNPQDAKQR